MLVTRFFAMFNIDALKYKFQIDSKCFWLQYSKLMPKLFEQFQKTSIQCPTSVPSESSFSIAGNLKLSI
jgi:hypothetical protein